MLEPAVIHTSHAFGTGRMQAQRTATNDNRLFKALERLADSKSGGAALELAVVAPFLFLLIIGVVDYGRAFFTSVTVANAARAGAEYGAQNVATSTDTAGMKSFAQADGQDAGTLTVAARQYCKCAGVAHTCSTVCAGGAVPEVYVEVTATKKLAMLLKYPGLADTITVLRKATFRSQ
jgi:Flp pilus assembly protein TadG